MTPVVTPPGVAEAGSVLAPDSAIDVGIPLVYTEHDMLDLMDRVLPSWYLDPLKANASSGFELLQAFGALMAKASLSVGQLQVLATLAFSSGGQAAKASVQFYRSSLASGAFTVQAGSIVSCSRSSRQYQLAQDLAFGSSDFVKAALVYSLGQDSDYNVPGPVVLQDFTVLAGEIDTVVVPYTSPPFADASLSVRQLADATGGTAPVLDQIGEDRGITRSANESDANYKKRVRALPDTISPAAIQRHLDALFYPAGLHYDFIETWANRFNSCWNAPIGGPTDPVFGTLVALAYNDSRTDRFIPRWMGERDHRGAFVVVVPTFPTIEDRGEAYNDPVTAATTTRGTSVWNGPSDSPTDLAGVWNGQDSAGINSRAAFLHSMYDLLRNIKGGGVDVAFVPVEANETLPGAPYP